jgi:hypothetical protein
MAAIDQVIKWRMEPNGAEISMATRIAEYKEAASTLQRECQGVVTVSACQLLPCEEL